MRLHQDVALQQVPSLRIIRIILYPTVYSKVAVETNDLKVTTLPIGDRKVPEGGFDITAIVSKTTITESVFSLANFGEITVFDARNLLEEALINGQERIYIEFEKITLVNGRKVTDRFAKNYYVTELKDYYRDNKKQTYTLSFVSHFAYKNLTNRISKGFCKKYPEEIIEHILTEFLDIPQECVEVWPEKSTNKLSLVVPNFRPFTAIKWVLKSIVTVLPSGGEQIPSPWVIYETFFGGVIRLEPYLIFKTGYSDEGGGGGEGSVLSSFAVGNYRNKIITETFYQNKFFNYGFGSKGDFQQRKQTILEMDSNLSFNKYSKGESGSYGSNRYLLDVAQKTFYTDDPKDNQHAEYDYRNWPNAITIEEYAPFAPHDLSNENAPKLQDTNYNYFVPYNSMANGNQENTFPYNYKFSDEKMNNKMGQGRDMIMDNIDFMEHRIKVYGDLRYSPGKVVKIMVPKAVDTDFFVTGGGEFRPGYNPKEIEDEYISGNYFITTVDHIIDKDGYFCKMTINRDSSPQQLEGY